MSNNIFTSHPRSQGMGYWRHLLRALGYSFRLLLAALSGILHGLFPFLFPTTMSDQVMVMAKEFHEFKQTLKDNDLSS